MNTEETLISLQSVTETQQITRTELDDNTVIKRASGGRALMGIYFKQNDIAELKKTVIQLCGDITMKGPSIKRVHKILLAQKHVFPLNRRFPLHFPFVCGLHLSVMFLMLAF
jgi:hypothetical protein